MADDSSLLRAWRGGDTAAGNRLFRRHFDGVYWFFLSKLPEQADDLTQETFRALVGNRETLDAQSFRAYLFITARNKLYDALRRRQRRGEWDPLSCSLADLGISPSGHLARRAEHELLLHALCELPLDLQILLELRFFEQLRGPELAQALEIPEGTVRSRLRRAMAQLRESMTRLAKEPGLVQITLDDLEGWAAKLREQVPSTQADGDP